MSNPIQNLKLPCLCKMDQQVVQLSLSLLIVFTFTFALSKSEALLLMAGDFPTLLIGMTGSQIFTSLPISLCIFSLRLGTNKFCWLFFFGFGFLSRDFFGNNCFWFFYFFLNNFIRFAFCLSRFVLFFLITFRFFLILFFVSYFLLFFLFVLNLAYPLILCFPEKVFDILVLLILKALHILVLCFCIVIWKFQKSFLSSTSTSPIFPFLLFCFFLLILFML